MQVAERWILAPLRKQRSPLLIDALPKIIAIDHANLRGSAYYQQLLLEA